MYVPAYTVTKPNQNEALLCKIAVLGMKKQNISMGEGQSVPLTIESGTVRLGWRNPASGLVTVYLCNIPISFLKGFHEVSEYVVN
jgi:hypothetical protein